MKGHVAQSKSLSYWRVLLFWDKSRGLYEERNTLHQAVATQLLIRKWQYLIVDSSPK